MRQKVSVYFEFWKTMVYWIDMYLDGLDDDDFKNEITPGGNHGIWLLGHLVASEDDLAVYLGKGKLLFPKYQELFKQSTETTLAFLEYPDVTTLKNSWRKVVEKNKSIYEGMTDEELDLPHEEISGNVKDDYFKTKGGCMKNWILHQMHHAGQFASLRTLSGKERLV